MMDSATKEKILRAGIAAPSADNSQPWRFTWRQECLDLCIDATRSGAVSDSRYVLSDLASGACLENMLIRGRALGYDAEVQLLPGSDQLWVARLHWRASAASHPAAPLAEAIEQRGTDRRFPWTGPIATETRQRITAELRTSPGVALHWLESSEEKRVALSALYQAETLRFRSSRLHAEMFSSIKFSSGWRASCEEGLAPASLAVEAPLRPIFKTLRRAPVMAGLRGLGAAPLLGFRSATLPVRLSPCLCLLSVQSHDRLSLLSAARAFERLWLQATLQGLSLQPYAAAGVLSLGFVTLEPTFSDSLARLRRTMQTLCPNRHGVVFFRLGRAKSARPTRSGRRALESFI